MPSSQPGSNIRAYVQWRNPSVFAGESVECVITFKNIGTATSYAAQSNGHPALHNGLQREARYTPSVAQTVASSTIPSSRPTHTRTPSISSVQHAPPARGHRPTLSLNLARSSSVKGGSGTPLSARTPIIAPVKGHGRSLSIISLGKESAAGRQTPTTIAATRKPPARGHNRSSSMQVTSRLGLQTTQSMSALPTRRQSPLFEATPASSLPDNLGDQLPVRHVRRRPGTMSAGNTPKLAQESFEDRATDREPMPDFEFPPRNTSLTTISSPQKAVARPARTISNLHSAQPVRPLSPRATDSWSNSANINPLNRVLSESSTSGTPRSSGDFYSLSNHSDETFSSDAASHIPSNDPPVTTPKPTKLSRSKQHVLGPARPETLMMGYARTTGSFTLDGSLVNNAPFEDVKRKTVQGGGGVVGVEKPKRSSGVFGAFGWGNFGESIGGLLGGNEMSTIAQMKASAGTKSVPLLSTPQSLLFVDITLAPGESRSFVYRFPLPKGLPPSHKGRAIKVEYSLSIGVQRPEGQSVKYVDIPFRVLGSVTSHGEPLGHDLMNPYVLLQDSARTHSIAATPTLHGLSSLFQKNDVVKKAAGPQKGLESFLRYTERLLDTHDDTNTALLSPTVPLSPVASRNSSITEQHHHSGSTKEAIDFALQNANIVSQEDDEDDERGASNSRSTNRFNIARSGQPVAVLTLLRPAYRLGESVTGIIDFTASPASLNLPAQIQSYSVSIELQSAERVDSLLAVRSAASIQRVTRRVHAFTRENSLFARRLCFSLAIPANATPSFDTSGVSLFWTLKIEFTTYRQLRGPGGDDKVNEDLLEELSRDERGISLIAKERLIAETFEIAVPLRVFGAFSIDGIDDEPDAYEI